jgi:hypothetical protein
MDPRHRTLRQSTDSLDAGLLKRELSRTAKIRIDTAEFGLGKKRKRGEHAFLGRVSAGGN